MKLVKIAVTPCKGCVDWNLLSSTGWLYFVRHTLQRVCGLKFPARPYKYFSPPGHTLQRVCGLKYRKTLRFAASHHVTPCKGCVDWNIFTIPPETSIFSHTLQRVCGLKSEYPLASRYTVSSHPAKGVWIEIQRTNVHFLSTEVTPCKGCVDWNHPTRHYLRPLLCHTLQRVCGLKFLGLLPCLYSCSHTLQRVCGLKFFIFASICGFAMSHPAKGVWIEIIILKEPDISLPVTPCKGCVDWNYQSTLIQCFFDGVTPCKGCVDWNGIIMAQWFPNLVTPCKGCVDWNSICMWITSMGTPSHPAKGVWIEIKTFVALPERQKVTPCKGGLKYIRYECYSLLIV